MGLRIDISWEHTWTRDRPAAQTTSNPPLLCTPGNRRRVWSGRSEKSPSLDIQIGSTSRLLLFSFSFKNWGMSRMGGDDHHINTRRPFRYSLREEEPSTSEPTRRHHSLSDTMVSYVLRVFSIIRRWLFFFFFTFRTGRIGSPPPRVGKEETQKTWVMMDRIEPNLEKGGIWEHSVCE